MSWFTKFFFQTMGICALLLTVGIGTADSAFAAKEENNKDVATQVICNVILFVQKLGLPIMTGVILGASVMAIFGRLAWPAIAMLVAFTAVFFGAGKLISKFAAGVPSLEADSFECTKK